MTDARKLRIHERANGLCEEPTCARPLPVFGPTVTYDHIIALDLGGDDVDSNVQILCTVPCNAIKFARDMLAIAKNRRLRAREDGTRRERAQIKSAGFNKSLRKRMNGKVEVRT